MTNKNNLSAFKNLGNESIKAKEKEKIPEKINQPKAISKPSIKDRIHQIRHDSWGIPIPSVNVSSTYNIDIGIAALENTLSETITKLNNCKNPDQKVELERKIFEMKKQLEALRYQKNMTKPTIHEGILKKPF